MSLFDENLFDDEAFDIELGALTSFQPMTGYAMREPKKIGTAFTFTLLGYINVRRVFETALLSIGSIGIKINENIVISVEAITRFSEQLVIDSFMLPNNTPTDIWSRIPADVWEKLVDKKRMS